MPGFAFCITAAFLFGCALADEIGQRQDADPHDKLVDALVSLEHALINICYHSGGKDLPVWNTVTISSKVAGEAKVDGWWSMVKVPSWRGNRDCYAVYQYCLLPVERWHAIMTFK
jgi:hypothetical protein